MNQYVSIEDRLRDVARDVGAHLLVTQLDSGAHVARIEWISQTPRLFGVFKLGSDVVMAREAHGSDEHAAMVSLWAALHKQGLA